MSLITLLRPRAAPLLFAAVLASGCAPRAIPLAADHPANPDAETGRLAGPPSALRAGIAQLDEPAPRSSAAPAHDHSTHEHGASKATPAPAAGAHQHGTETKAPSDEKPAPAPKKTAPKTSAPKTTAPKPPAQKPAPEKPAPAPERPAPAKPAPHPPGHEGHH